MKSIKLLKISIPIVLLAEDKDTVNKITEKWDAREDLAGKTKSQILKLVFKEVKSVITDAEITKNIWDS